MKINLITFYLVSVLALASVIDIRSLRIPNWLTYSTFAVGLSYFAIMKGSEGFLYSVLGAGVGVGLLFLPYIIGGTGAGDVKLLGSVGSVLGPHSVFEVFIISCALGGVYALLALAFRGLILDTFKRYGRTLKVLLMTGQLIYIPPGMKEKQVKIRFGLVIALATCWYMVFASKFQA